MGFISVIISSSIISVHSLIIKYPPSLGNHIIRTDTQGKILSWITPQQNAYDKVIDIAWDFIKNKAPIEANGYKGYIVSCSFDIFSNPGYATNNSLDMAGLFGEFVDSVIPYYAYTGNWSYVEVVKQMLDHALIYGLTPDSWEWPNMPYAWSPRGNLNYSGRIEPDKAGEFGLGLLKFYQLTKESKYLDTALDIADVLAEKVREGNATHSPWPHRIFPKNGQILVEYTGNVVGELNFLDALINLKLGNVQNYENARNIARNFLLNHVIPNNDWRYYFEDYLDDCPTKSEFNADETARYLIENKDWDPDWEDHIKSIWKWVEEVLGEHAWKDYGVLPISEQTIDLYYGEFSHTARHASVKAQYAAIKEDLNFKDEAFRLFNWATYGVQEDTGFVLFSANNLDNSEIWYTDGYADFIRHFMAGMAAFPEWAPPNESHLVKATSIVQTISYAQNYIYYETYDAPSDCIDTFRINFIPSSIKAGGLALTQHTDLDSLGYLLNSLSDGGYVLKIQHAGERCVYIYK